MESTIKQYSEALMAGESENKLTLSSIRNVVKQVVNTERIDRSKNVIIFGLEETSDENTVKATEEILESIQLKPKIMSATRFGRTENDKIRPIRVTFEKSDAVHDVLKTSRMLKSTERFRKVYISVDRSAEQQARHKELVKTLNKKISEQPNRKWYIKNNQVRYDDSVNDKLEDVTKIHQHSATEPSPKKVTKHMRPPFRKPGPATARRPAYSSSHTDTDSD
jgi:DNA mismatch repair ATPase MutS